MAWKTSFHHQKCSHCFVSCLMKIRSLFFFFFFNLCFDTSHNKRRRRMELKGRSLLGSVRIIGIIVMLTCSWCCSWWHWHPDTRHQAAVNRRALFGLWSRLLQCQKPCAFSHSGLLQPRRFVQAIYRSAEVSRTPQFDARIVLRYDRVRLNVMWWMNRQQFTLCIGNAYASSSFTWHIFVDEIQSIPKKPVSSSQTSAECYEFHDTRSLKYRFKVKPNVIVLTRWVICVKDRWRNYSIRKLVCHSERTNQKHSTNSLFTFSLWKYLQTARVEKTLNKFFVHFSTVEISANSWCRE